MRMKREIRERWVKALRSGEYTQARKALHVEGGGYCCLGVLCDLAKQAGVVVETLQYEPDVDATVGMFTPVNADRSTMVGRDESALVLPYAVCEWAGLTRSLVVNSDRVIHLSDPQVEVEGNSENLTALNDDYAWSLAWIADAIENDPEREEDLA